MTGWSWVRIGAVLGFLAVGIGAFGAHGLKSRLAALGTSEPFQTAVQYHMWHALAILAVGLFAGPFRPGMAASVAGWSFLIGVILFSGSLYILALTGLSKFGMITPIGGVAFLVGWLALSNAAWSVPAIADPGLTTFLTAEGKSGVAYQETMSDEE
ncbi:MAG: DUF423 domain-containing protein [Isosphaeraceae bacterium]